MLCPAERQSWQGCLLTFTCGSCLQILTKALTAAVLNGIGDLIAQFAVEKKDKLDLGRFIRFTGLVGGLGGRENVVLGEVYVANADANLKKFLLYCLCGLITSSLKPRRRR